MNFCALARSRLATATSREFSARLMAFQFFRAILAAPTIPQLQNVCDMIRRDEN
jgi:hypothetical protein